MGLKGVVSVTIMCMYAAAHAVSEVLIRFEDHTVFVAYERSCGCTGLRPATPADLERGLVMLEGEPDEPAGIPALALVA
jgi:hypothetical protein